MLKIAIDSGHGLNTAGKEVPAYMGLGKIKEWTLNDKITRALMNLLKDYNVEILRLDDPTGKTDIPVKDRTKKANEWGADILISNHHNAGIGGKTGGGLVVIRKAGSALFTREMQKLLYDCILAETGLKGNRYEPLAEYKNLILLNTAKMPTVLIEHGFMDSPSDMKVVMQDDFAEKSARGIVNFLEKQYGIIKGEEGGDILITRTLKFGMTGEDVGRVQKLLKDLGYYKGPIDNSYGPGQGFANAVKAFQKSVGLEPDGSIGPLTRAKINPLLLSWPEKPSVPKVDKLEQAKELARKILEL